MHFVTHQKKSLTSKIKGEYRILNLGSPKSKKDKVVQKVYQNQRFAKQSSDKCCGKLQIYIQKMGKKNIILNSGIVGITNSKSLQSYGYKTFSHLHVIVD